MKTMPVRLPRVTVDVRDGHNSSATSADRGVWRHVCLSVGLLAVLFGLSACALLGPLPTSTTLTERLEVIPTDGLPLQKPVTVHWNGNQIPFIEAQDDRDLALTLGLVHAHLRLGQMEFLKRIAQGRLSEVAGPFANDLDHTLRILDFRRAVPAIQESLPDETRGWLEAFVDGVNLYRERVKQRPHEFAVYDLDDEPWTVADVLTVGRLAAFDINWLFWLTLFELRQSPEWPRVWQSLVEAGSLSAPSFRGGGNGIQSSLPGIYTGQGGSNSIVVSAGLSATGGALMANDPHLNLSLPNAWLVAGVRSPSFHAVGLMVPGLPFFAIGRNPWIAWGATNMRAASSDLVDLSGVDEPVIRERSETIRTRWWFDHEVSIRESRFGPVVSDSPLLGIPTDEVVALRWTGHDLSDEVTAMLNVARARSWKEYRSALGTFAVPGLNMLYADHLGNIGQAMAVRLPTRDASVPNDLVVSAETAARAWARTQDVSDWPYAFNPPDGFLASSNNRPAATEVPVGYFFAPNDRIDRIKESLSNGHKFDLDALTVLQQDVFVASSDQLRRAFLDLIDRYGLRDREPSVVEALASWDGHYEQQSRGALAFEVFLSGFVYGFYDEGKAQIFFRTGGLPSILKRDLEMAPDAQIVAALEAALKEAGAQLATHSYWGDLHRMRLAHPLANLPLLGHRFVFTDFPVAGSNSSVFQTAFVPTSERHGVHYGTNARTLFDLSDPDENYFVLLGGQDGWINSSTFLDQVPLWQNGTYVRVPLRLEVIGRDYPYKTVFEPAGGTARAAETSTRM